MDSKWDPWIEDSLPRHSRLTPVVASLIESLLIRAKISYLTVSHRTKDRAGILEKIERKGYRDPRAQLTDVSGIRIVVYFETDVIRVSDVILNAFRVDTENSRNRDELLSVNETGYRSTHYVCDVGPARSILPEFEGMSDLKFEFQVRTILQHAWAELAHDRNYKLSSSLPREMERQLYLYAGMLEIADRGFDQLSTQIDDYAAKLASGSTDNLMMANLDSVSLATFVQRWCMETGFQLESSLEKSIPSILNELSALKIGTAGELNNIIPVSYADVAARIGYSTNIYGLVRDWMLIHDWRRLLDATDLGWTLGEDEECAILREYLKQDEFEELSRRLDGFEY